MTEVKRLESIGYDEVVRFCAEVKRAICGPASKLNNVGHGFEGIGPREMYGQNSGLAYGRRKIHRAAVSNREMAKKMMDEELVKNPQLQPDELQAKIFPPEEKSIRDLSQARLRENGQAAITCALTFISPDLLMNLNNDKGFRNAAQGTCVVTFVEELHRMAACRMRNPREDRKEAKTALENTVMEDNNFYLWKVAFETGMGRCDHAECNIPDQEVLEIAINGLSNDVFPFVRRDFYGKTNEYKSLTDIESLWNLLEQEYVLYLRDPRSRTPGNMQGKRKEQKDNQTEDHRAYFLDQIACVVNASVETSLGNLGKRKLASKENLRPGQKNFFCHNFAEKGVCNFNENCRFRHSSDKDELRKAGYRPRSEDFWNPNLNRSTMQSDTERLMKSLSALVDKLESKETSNEAVAKKAKAEVGENKQSLSEVLKVFKADMMKGKEEN